LAKQPRRIAARTIAERECFLGRPHSRFEADQVLDIAPEALVDGDQKINRARAEVWGLGSGVRSQKYVVRGQLELHITKDILESRREGSLQLKRLKLVAEQRVVLEREPIGLGLEVKIERVQHGHLGHEVHFDEEFAGLFQEHQPRKIIRLRILLPVDVMLGRPDAQRVAQDACARVRRGTQPDNLRAKRDQAVVAVVGTVVQGDVNGHGDISLGVTRDEWREAIGSGAGQESRLPAEFGHLLPVSRSETTMVAVGLSPRTAAKRAVRRRGASPERANRTGAFNRRSATGDHDTPRPWTEVHGYLHGLAPRGGEPFCLPVLAASLTPVEPSGQGCLEYQQARWLPYKSRRGRDARAGGRDGCPTTGPMAGEAFHCGCSFTAFLAERGVLKAKNVS